MRCIDTNDKADANANANASRKANAAGNANSNANTNTKADRCHYECMPNANYWCKGIYALDKTKNRNEK